MIIFIMINLFTVRYCDTFDKDAYLASGSGNSLK